MSLKVRSAKVFNICQHLEHKVDEIQWFRTGINNNISPILSQCFQNTVCICVCVCRGGLEGAVCSVTQLCLTACDPMDCSPPGSSVHGIFQARILEWAAISYSRVSSWPKNQTCVSCVSCIGRRVLYHRTTWEALPFKSTGKPVLMDQLWAVEPGACLRHVCTWCVSLAQVI